MKKIGDSLLRIILATLFGLTIWIILTGILEYNKVVFEYNPLLLILGIGIYIFLIIIFYKYILEKIEKLRFIEYFLFIIFLVLCILSGLYFKVNPTWDMGTTFDIAKEYVDNGTYTNTFYLSQFPNNIMMMIFDVIILKIFSSIGINDYLTGITIFTAFIISFSIIITFFIVKKIFNRKKALMFLFICIFTTPLYLYVPEYYTDTFSMLTTVLLFGIWLIIKEQRSTAKCIVWECLYGIILFVAIKLKLTSAFVFIAIFIYEFFRGNIKDLAKKSIIILPVAVIMIILFNNIIVKKLAPDELRYINEVPTEHWIMMGMNGVGKFSPEEYAYTNANRTYPEKQNAARKMIIERLKGRTVNTHIKNLTLKLGFAWHDGTYWYPEVLRREPVERKILHEFVLEGGTYSDYYKYFPQIMHFSMLIFIAINLKRIIREKQYESKDIISLITMLGVMLFLLIWENRSRYIVNILPLLIMNQINGIEYVCNKLKRKKYLCESNKV